MNGLMHVFAYNDISRLRFEPLSSTPPINKQEIADHIRAMGKNDQAKLLSKLIAIKYYRQTGIFSCGNNFEDVGAQDRLWEEIETETLLPPDTTLTDLMAFIKNDSIIPRKLPIELQDVIINVSNKQKVIDHFKDDERSKMCEYLNEATEETWNDNKLRGVPEKPYLIRLVSTTQSEWEPFTQSRNNYNSAALCTVTQILGKRLPETLSKVSTTYESDIEKTTRTPDGFVQLAKKNGLTNAQAVIPSSAEEYRQHIIDSLQEGIPLVAPFLVDGGWDLSELLPYDFLPNVLKKWKGIPIIKQETLHQMGRPLQELIEKSLTFRLFRAAVATYQNIGDHPIPNTILTIPENATKLEARALRKPIRETQRAVEQFIAIIKEMTEEIFQALKSGSMNIKDYIVNNHIAHSAVVIAYNYHTDMVTIAHCGQTYQTGSASLYMSAQLLPDALKGVLYTFHIEPGPDALANM